MADSLLSLDAIRRVFRLLGECTELGADPIAWRKHLAGRCPEVIAEGFVNLVESTLPEAPGEAPAPVAVDYFTGGPLPNEDYKLIGRFMETPAAISPIVLSILQAREPSVTRLRRELVPDDAWSRSVFFQDYVRPLGLNDQLTSIESAAPKTVSTICILTCGRKVFTPRQARILELLHQEVTRLKHEGKLAPLGGFSLWDLPPRQRQVLYGLFQGDNERQLALRLGVSGHTVHDYLKALHQRFQVSSRGELMSRCAKYYPVLNRFAGPSASAED